MTFRNLRAGRLHIQVMWSWIVANRDWIYKRGEKALRCGALAVARPVTCLGSVFFCHITIHSLHGQTNQQWIIEEVATPDS